MVISEIIDPLVEGNLDAVDEYSRFINFLDVSSVVFRHDLRLYSRFKTGYSSYKWKLIVDYTLDSLDVSGKKFGCGKIFS